MGATFSRKRAVGRMGAGSFPSLLHETKIFAQWSMADVKELFKRFRTQVFGFALVEAQFESIMSFKESLKKHVPLDELFRILDDDHDGRIDGLELLGGLALCCQASFEEKIRFCFELYDFNLNSNLSKQEMVMMMMASICGINILTGGGEALEPDLEEFEAIAEDAFHKADTDNSGVISYEEFVEWARSNRELMDGMESMNRLAAQAMEDQDSEDSAEEVDELELEDFAALGNKADEDLSVGLKKAKKSNGGTKDSPISVAENLSTQWRQQAEEPTNWQPLVGANEGPETNLELHWAHGYNALGQCRNNMMGVWTEGAEGFSRVVYPAAALCVVMELPSENGPKNRDQLFYTGHRAQVTCLDAHRNGHVVASGDAASEIHIWDAMTLACQIIIKCLVKEGVQNIIFSPCGTRIATVGRDSERTVSIYDVATGDILSSCKGLGFPNKVMDLAFSPNGEEVVVVGKAVVKFIKGIKSKQRALTPVVGKIGHMGKKQTFFCCEYFADGLVVGCASGEMYLFKDRRCVTIVQAHVLNEPILSMSCNDGILVTGAKDGFIKTWDSTLKEVGSALDITADVDGDGEPDSGCLDSSVTAVCMRGKHLLIGTKSSDGFIAWVPTNPTETHELERVCWGHSSGKLVGLTLHPTRDEFATSGDDKTVRLWSLRSNEQVDIRNLPESSRALCYSPNGDVLAVGMENGQIAMMNSRSLRAYDTWTHTTAGITVMRFSPDGRYLAVGDAHCNVYLYMSGNKRNYKRHAICRGHGDAITCMDFSSNSQFLQSNDSGSTLRFWDVRGNEIKTAEHMRDVNWATHTCVYTWATSGIHGPKDPSNTYLACEGVEDIGIMATARKDGSLHLFSYPVEGDKSISQSYDGHASAVTNVRVSMNRRFIVSVGGEDNTILVWQNEMERADDEEDSTPAPDDASTSVTDIIDALGAIVEVETGPAIMKSPLSGGDEFMSVMPWKAAVLNLQPSKPTFDPKDIDKYNAATDVDLDLLWVHGYRCHDCRNNARFTAAGSLVYSAAALGVVYSKYTGRQEFLQGVHSDDIIGLALHPAGNVCATGQIGKKPILCIWDTQSMQAIVTMKTKHGRGIPLLSFNDSGNNLATVGLDNDSTLIVYDWAKKITVLETPTAKEKVFCVAFMTQGSSPGKDRSSSNRSGGGGGGRRSKSAVSDIVITGGEKHLKFWWSVGRNIKGQKGLWGPTRRTHVLCAVSPAKDLVVTGGIDGNLHLWEDFKCTSTVKGHMESTFTHTHPCSIEYPHKSAIQAIWCDKKEDDVVEVEQSMWDWAMEGGSSGRIEYPSGVTAADLDAATTIFTGDKLGVVACWKVVSIDGTTQLEYIYHMHMGDLRPRPQNLSVRSVCEQAGVLAVGTLGSEIFEVPVTSVAAAIAASRAASPVKEDGAKVGAREHGVAGHNAATPAPGDCRRLISGHSQGEVWGLCPHPTENVFLTAGDDQTIRCWNLVENKCLTWIKLKDKSRAVAWRPTRHDEEEEVAVATNGGMIYILDARVFINPKALVASVDPSAAADAPKAAVDTSLDALRVYVADGRGRAAAVRAGQAVDVSPEATDGKRIGIKHAFKGPKKWVQDLKYSFEGSFLAVGSHDSNIYLYDVGSGYEPSLTRVLKAHSSYITHIDFGLQLTGPEETYDSKKGKLTIRDVSGKDAPRELDIKDCKDRVVMRSTCGAYELLFWYAASGARIKFASSLRDAWWATLTCPFGWGVQGIWPAGADGTDINAVARSHTYQDVPVVATVDDFGLVKVFNYPCLTVGAPDKCYKGHSAHVTNLGFSADDSYLITTGGDDKCVFVWSTDILEELRERKASSTNTHDSIAHAADDELEADAYPVRMVTSGGDESKAVKPWLGAVREPSNWTEPANMGAAPEAALEMSFVYGYCPGGGNMGHADSVQEVCYHVAGVGIVYNMETHTQVHNTEHDNDILCLAVHPEGHTVATGEQAPKGKGNKPKIVLWDANTGVTLRVIKFHTKGVSHVCFSGSGSMIVSIGLDNDRTVAVHSTSTGAKLGTGKIGKGVPIFSLSVGGDSYFCTGGKRFVKFWDFPGPKGVASELASKKGMYGRIDGSRNVMSSSYMHNDAVTGMYDGSLILWKNREAKKRVANAHSKAVTAMCAFSSGDKRGGGVGGDDAGPMILTGAADGLIIQWNDQLKRLKRVDLNVIPLPISINMCALSMMQGKVVVGTRGAEIFEVDWLSGEHLKIVDGHFSTRGELWGLAVRPTKPEFATAADDKTLRVWNARAQQPVGEPVDVGGKVRALAYSHDGFQLAAANFDGLVQVFNADDISVKIGEVQLSKEWIQVMEFSPDGRMLAVGSHDSRVHVIDSRTFSTKNVLKGHHSSVIGVDFSTDSKVLRSVSTDEELLFWDTATGKQITSASSVRDTKWATCRCVLGWGVQGIWPPFSDKTDVNSCDRSPDGSLLATGDDFHFVKLFKYPCVKDKSAFKAYKGHSEHVPTVRFSKCGSHLFSVGGIDKAIIQYSVKYPKNK